MRTQDRCRGKLPVIRAEQDTITFIMAIDLREDLAPELILRCERDGEICVSIRWEPPRS